MVAILELIFIVAAVYILFLSLGRILNKITKRPRTLTAAEKLKRLQDLEKEKLNLETELEITEGLVEVGDIVTERRAQLDALETKLKAKRDP